MDFQNFNSVVIPSEEPTLDASIALLRHENADGKSKIVKNSKRRGVGRLTFWKQKNDISGDILSKIVFSNFQSC